MFSLERRLVCQLALTNGIVLLCATVLYLVRGYLKRETFEPGQTLATWLLHELMSDVAPVMIPLFVSSLVVSVLTIRRGLAPVKEASRQAADFNPALLGVRLPSQGIPLEVLPLIQAVNAGLDRLSEGFETQKRFTACAAHELRTPLAVLKARCSSMNEACAETVIADIGRMARVIDQLLAVARLETRQIPMDAMVSLNAVCTRVVSDLYPLALEQNRDLGLLAEGVWQLPQGNEPTLTDALRNVVENALRLSPEGETVEVELRAPGIILVLDRGSGVPDDKKVEIFQPFRRCGGALGGGAGLGLSIAMEIVTLHGGVLSVSDRDGGGAVFSLDFSGAGNL